MDPGAQSTDLTADHHQPDDQFASKLLTFPNEYPTLGSGNFGIVRRGILRKNGETIDVAVKTHKPNTPVVTFEEMIQSEYSAMKSVGFHDNIIKLVGIVSDKPPTMLLMELIHGSNFHDIIWKTKPTDQQKLTILVDFASGLTYVHSRGIVHRDVAARNCLVVSATGHGKVDDFGLAKMLDSKGSYKGERTNIPVKWTSIESLKTLLWTRASDSWSMGVVIFEAFKYRQQPYADLIGEVSPTWESMSKCLHDGHRLELSPEEAKPEIIAIMKECFMDEMNRPSIDKIRGDLDALIVDHAGSPVQVPPPKKDEVPDNSDYYNDPKPKE